MPLQALTIRPVQTRFYTGSKKAFEIQGLFFRLQKSEYVRANADIEETEPWN